VATTATKNRATGSTTEGHAVRLPLSRFHAAAGRTPRKEPLGKEVIRVVPGGIIGVLLIIVLVLLIIRLA
jgi:hypothetical protein